MFARRLAAAGLFALLSVAPCIAWSEEFGDAILQLIVRDAISRGDLANFEWRVFTVQPIPVGEGATRLVDRPLMPSSVPFARPGVAEVLGRVLEFGEPSKAVTIDPRQLQERQYLSRILFRRNPLLLRLLLGLKEYQEPLTSSVFVDRYFELLLAWAKSMDTLRALEGSSAPVAVIEEARSAAKKKLFELETVGVGSIIRIASRRFAGFTSRSPLLAWGAAIEKYQLYSNVGTRDPGEAAPVSFEVGGRQWNSVVLRGNPSGAKISYQIQKIRRAWVEDTILFFRPWAWARSSPFGGVISAGKDCDADDLLPCLTERVIVVRGRDPSGQDVDLVVGLIGEILPRSPPDDGDGNANLSPVGHSDYGFSDVVGRLRNGTF